MPLYIRLTEIKWADATNKLPSEIPFFVLQSSGNITDELFESYGVIPVSYKVEIIKDADKAALNLFLPGLF